VDRRRFVLSAAGVGTAVLAGPPLGTARAATEDELAFANFGASAEYLVRDFYAKALKADLVDGPGASVLRWGRRAAARHARALSDLLVGAGDVAPPLDEDFDFDWPAGTFRSEKAMATTGPGVLRALLGAYQTAAASVEVPSYRVLYASLAASVGQQFGALAALERSVGAEPFPVALELEAASDALEEYLG
jgi:Ferritin-like domain